MEMRIKLMKLHIGYCHFKKNKKKYKILKIKVHS